MFQIFKKNIKYNKGVTILELIVVIAIFMILTAIGIFDYNKFKSSISLQNLADDIALSIRKAQGLAIGVSNSSNSYESGYGVYFSTSSPQQFTIFVDIDGNKEYTTNNDEIIETLTIKNNDKISKIYNDNEDILSEANIVFLRPNPEPILAGGVSSITIQISNAKVDILKTVTAHSNGQIAVSQ